ncbi:MAG: sulfatase-like hydrolase/transferase, partial [Lacibacter sp.]|nr:sulfatase-like hydrolase/transferase [Lacibacter sp.]
YVQNHSQTDLSSGIGSAMCAKAISNNKTMEFFRSNGYKIINNSFFPVQQSESIRELFLPTEERLILDKTFGQVFMHDLIASVSSNKLHFFLKDGAAKTDLYNQKVISKTKKDIENAQSPNFLYAHFMMPHFPYLRDSSGKLKDIGKAYIESNMGRNKKSYVSYLRYCNTIMISLIDDILKKDNDAIIILASDHGMREGLKVNLRFTEFNNFLAIHTPGNNHKGFTDTTSLVNVFRIILNNHFKQHLPLLKDEFVDFKK